MKDTPGRPDESLPARRSPPTPPVAPPHAEGHDDYQDHPQPSGKSVSFRLVSRALRRHWWQALVLWLAGSAALMALAHAKITPTFDAVSQVKVEIDQNGLFANNGQNQDANQFMQTQVSLMTNPTIIGSALAKHPELLDTPLLKGTADPEIEVRNALRAGMVPKTNLIQVEMSSPNPAEAAKLVNAVVEAYLTQAQQTYDSSTQKRIDLLKVTRDEQRAVVEKQRKYFEGLSRDTEAGDAEFLKEKGNVSLDLYRRWSEELTNVEIMVITAKAKLDMLRNVKELPKNLDGDQVRLAISDLFLSDPNVLTIDTEIDRAQHKLKRAEHLSRSKNDPACIAARERIAELEADKKELWKKLEPRLRRQVAAAPVDNDVEHGIKEAETELNAKMVQQETLQKKLDQANIVNKTAGANQLKMEYARRDLQRAEGVLDRIDDTLNQYRFNARNPTARVELNYLATPSTRPNSDRRTQVMAVAPLATGALVLALLMLLELRGARVGDPDELASRMQLQVIGVVPPLPQIRAPTRADGDNGAGAPISASDFRAQRQLDEFVQSLDHLRVALCARRDPWGRERHCVLITSAIGSEGKTTLAAQLAERCVNAGLMTLVIDADLRNPTLSRMLDASTSPGLINVLRGEREAEDVVTIVGEAGGFHFLPAGTPRVDPSRLLQSDRLGHLIAAARESFEMIIVDAPPVLPVPDALTIGKWTDGAVLAVRYDTSRFPLVERANRRLAHVGVPVLGAVVNGVRSSESAYGGYYAYGASSYGNLSTSLEE